MPELPEVETIRQQLSRVLPGLVIQDIQVKTRNIIIGDPLVLLHRKIIRLRRIGKMLVIDVSGGWSMAIHLKMTGRLVYQKVKSDPSKSFGTRKLKVKNLDVDYEKDKHTHVIITFTNRDQLYYNDQRKFGWIRVVKTSEIDKLPYVAKLGPEFLSNLNIEQFAKILQSSSRPVKLVITDQEKLAGSGNIYANEALWCARINPAAKANSLSDTQIITLFNCFEKILRQAIIWQGASRNNYRDAFGQKGRAQEHFEVYEQTGKLCRRCRTEIKKIKLGGRGTYYCPVCQHP